MHVQLSQNLQEPRVYPRADLDVVFISGFVMVHMSPK